MTAHAKFGPSKAHRWIPCPGSIALEPEGEGEQSDFADEGSAAHFWASNALQTDKDAEFFRDAEVQPRADGKSFTCDDEFILNIQVYLDDVRSRAAGGTLLVEQRLEFSETIGQPEQFGTGDAVIIQDAGELLIVEDLKYGMGVQVYAKDNEQCMMYALGALETYAPVLEGTVKVVRCVICQPRLDHIDEWDYTVEELMEFAEKAKLAARYAVDGMNSFAGGFDIEDQSPELFAPGDKQCRWCPAKATCKALERFVSADVYDDFTVIGDPNKLLLAPEPRIPPVARLGAIYTNLDLIEGWTRAVRGEVERQVQGGMIIEGADGQAMKIVEGKKGNRYWNEAQEPIVEGLLCGMAGFGPEKAYKPRQVITPSVADKMLGKKRHAEYETVLQPYVKQEPGKPKIALGSDPRPPYSGAASESEFSNVETEE
jgi:hypothetical protein